MDPQMFFISLPFSSFFSLSKDLQNMYPIGTNVSKMFSQYALNPCLLSLYEELLKERPFTWKMWIDNRLIYSFREG